MVKWMTRMRAAVVVSVWPKLFLRAGFQIFLPWAPDDLSNPFCYLPRTPWCPPTKNLPVQEPQRVIPLPPAITASPAVLRDAIHSSSLPPWHARSKAPT